MGAFGQEPPFQGTAEPRGERPFAAAREGSCGVGPAVAGREGEAVEDVQPGSIQQAGLVHGGELGERHGGDGRAGQRRPEQ